MTDPSTTTMLLLMLAGLAAGWVDAVVGGGGLIQLPALVLGLPGAAPVHILATNKLGSICGTSVSSVTYYRRVRPDLRTAVPMALVAFLGALGGAVVGLAPAQGRVQPDPARRAHGGRGLHAASARAGARTRCGSRATTTRWRNKKSKGLKKLAYLVSSGMLRILSRSESLLCRM